MALLLKSARCIDPLVGLDTICDISVRDGRIAEVGQDLSIPKGLTIDLTGKVLVPGLVDMHVHLRDPGQEYKEDIRTGAAAAARGGFTAILAMPNTDPVIDCGSVVRYVLERAAKVSRTRIYTAGALTAGLQGHDLAEIGDMVEAGVVAFSDDGRGVQDAGVMRRAMDYVKCFDKRVLSHCQDESLVGNGVVNEGRASTLLGLAGWPALGEEAQIARDIALSKLTGCPLHIQHLTTAEGADLVRKAKAEGLPVSCEVTPHHLFMNEDHLDATYNTSLKMNPPLRTKADNKALIEALLDGTIDTIATDHAPHAAHEKSLEFELAPYGTIGLETALSLILTNLVAPGIISWNRLIELMAHAPRRILGLELVSLKAHSVADLTIIDPEMTWTVEEHDFVSRSANSAFIGSVLKGRVTDVYVGGYASLENGELVD
ncbi:MAG: dihydroorotase [Coriobacteriaceae bacterium]|nr:dihydroorotase [Coriobacteriaceae bacterium]